MSPRYTFQQDDITRLTANSKRLTPLMREWIREAQSQQTDLGYEDWKINTRRTRQQKRETPPSV